jgi:hypothetical protein
MSIFNPIIFPSLSSSSSYSPPLPFPLIHYPTYERIVENSFIDLIEIKGVDANSLSSSLFSSSISSKITLNNSKLKPLTVRVVYNDNSKSLNVVLPKEAKTCEDWEVTINI